MPVDGLASPVVRALGRASGEAADQVPLGAQFDGVARLGQRRLDNHGALERHVDAHEDVECCRDPFRTDPERLKRLDEVL